MKTMGPAGKIARYFLNSKLTPLIIFGSLMLGLIAVWALPREEEPQIVVPVIDVFVQMPGATAKEVEERVTRPMEKLIWEIPGVEYIYSTSSPGMAMAVVRFYVGQDEERSLVRLNQKLQSNFDIIPPGASHPLVKPRSIDDVPILAITLSSERYDNSALRKVAAALTTELKQTPDVSEVKIIGGTRRILSVRILPEKLEAYQIPLLQVAPMISAANRQTRSGQFASGNTQYFVETSGFVSSPTDLGNLVIGAHKNRPVYLRNIAEISDGSAEAGEYVFYWDKKHVDENPAVTMSIAKRKNTNAVDLAETLLAKVEDWQKEIIPSDIKVTVTRNYGDTAREKSNELLFHMMLAVIFVTLLIAFALGRRESIVVAVAIPVTLALTLTVFYLYGYTLNRITLFALIFSIGILVDDAIVVVENIVRHRRLPENQGRDFAEVAAEAVDEVGNPTILATIAVIAAILPMAFVGGLMGPYMRPIPVGASAAMLFSLIVAFVVTPWASIRALKEKPGSEHVHETEGRITKFYRTYMAGLVENPRKRRTFIITLFVLLLASISLVAFKLVTVKMLPFDNKSEIQVVIDMPEGTTLEQTSRATLHLASYLRNVPEVVNYQTYVGTAAPYNFNGLVRHYFLRQGSNISDIQVNLVSKDERSRQSHEIATAIRKPLHDIAAEYNANVKVVEVPPGPPVLQTLVAEIYGPDYEKQIQIAKQIEKIFHETEGVVDVDSYIEERSPGYRFVVDRQRAAMLGISADQVTQTLQAALASSVAGLFHLPNEPEDVDIVIELPRAARSNIQRMTRLQLSSASGKLVPLSELGSLQEIRGEQNIYHKNLMPVVYVTGDVAGKEESPVYAILKLKESVSKTMEAQNISFEQYSSHQPFTTADFSMKWDGEWHITYEVFRDLGMAFAIVLILIYIIVVAWFHSFSMPLVIMAAIPFSLVGIFPGHAALGAFFTATSMIGFIAGAGIVVRNSIILVDFIELRIKEGMPLEEAVVDAGAVRFRPMLLTAAAVIAGSAVILFDPIFQGLAVSLMAGEVASLLLSRAAVPVFCYMLLKRQEVVPDQSIEILEGEKVL
jgi:multidrug efflux pump subunit AcrB